ncbi:MAG TPA: cytochrome c [Solirubrobacteraceae bacterium]|nr:cytochrome c [Solirubrobacteraceae bacterium]
MPGRRALAPMLVLAALALAACGGGDGGGGGPPGRQVVDQGDPAAGREVFADNCAACHGGDGGGGTGPRLAGEDALTDADLVVRQIREGGGGMPDFADRLSDQELADVSAFVVRELAAK